MVNRKATESIRDPKDIEKIRNRLTGRSRDLLLFDLATQTGLPASIWLRLKVKDLSGLKPGDEFKFEGNTKANRHHPVMTEILYHTFQTFIREKNYAPQEYLFKSKKGTEPLHISSVSRMVKAWHKKTGLSGMNGLLALRKAWKLHYRNDPVAQFFNSKNVTSDGSFKKMRFPTMQEAVYQELEKAIVSGNLKPGQRLITEEIAKLMGVSPIPVREALGRLDARGFISTKPQRGSVVNELSKENLIEIMELRLFMEGLAAKRAAQKRSEKALTNLKAVYHEYLKARRTNYTDEILKLNKEFHFTIYRAANMPILMYVINYLWDRTSPYFHLFHRQSEIPNPKRGIKYHKKILEGMVAGNSKIVYHWLKIDLTESAGFVKKLFELYYEK